MPWTDFLYGPYFSVDSSVCDYDVGTAAVVQEGNAERATETQQGMCEVKSVRKNPREFRDLVKDKHRKWKYETIYEKNVPTQTFWEMFL